MDRSHNRNNTINGFEEEKEKEKDDQYHHHHHQVGRRKRRRKDKASLFRETRLYSSVFRIIISDLNFKISALFSPKIISSLVGLLYYACAFRRAAKEERCSLFHGIIIVIHFILFYTHSLSLSQMKQQKTLSEFNKIPISSPSSKGKEETQKEAKNAVAAAPFKRKNFSSEEGDREEEEKTKEEEDSRKRSKGSEEDAYGEDEDKNTPKTRAAPTARERTTLKETEEDDDDDEEAILGTDVKGEKSERISPVGIDKEEKPDVEEEKANEERAAREASKEATTTTTTTSVGNNNGEEEQRKMSVLELHFGKRKPNPPKELKYDQKPKEMEPNAEPLPEELEEWKQFAEQQLANLVNLMRQKIIDCFHVRIAISVMMIACPAKELREVLKDLRDMKVIGNTMRPYLIYLREILDGCGEKYRDKLDADMEFSSSDEDESSSSDDNDDDDDESDSEEIPEITRGNGPLATTAQVRDATKIQGCSSSSEESDGDDNDEEDDDSSSSSEEEEEEEDVMKKPKYDRQRCQLFSKFLGRFMIENRVQEQVEAARLLRADECREFSNEECVQFLDLLQRQGKIMIDGPIIHVI